MYGEGISFTGELVDLGVKYGMVQKAGAWFSMDSVRLGQGRDNAKQYFKDHPEQAEELHKKIEAAIIAEREEAMKKGVRVTGSSKTADDGEGEETEAPARPAKATSSAKAVAIDADDFDDDLEL